ncbi:hypothetical protein [Actinomyces minihominis]|uniref:hypothetical protein n=1 Tax=Actinomyces minihominis TaxID=2002838 RepID=UPI000C080BDA|nr:hypothetical protein [Actinomyces minihominis]
MTNPTQGPQPQENHTEQLPHTEAPTQFFNNPYGPNPTMPPVTKVFVAPDGSRISMQDLPLGGPRVPTTPTPHGAATTGMPFASPAPSPEAPAPDFSAAAGYYAAPLYPRAEPGPAPISVGMLVWGVILMILGLMVVFSPITGAGGFQALIILLFAGAGIAFLVLAYLTSQKKGPFAENTEMGSAPYTAPTPDQGH